MAQSLEQFVAEATNAYQPAKNAVQAQLDTLSGQLATGENKINSQYAQQQAQLERQRNQAAEASSLAAAGSGGSFGGQGNLARRKYYEQSFVPAQTQLQTNQSNALDSLRQNIENQRASLNSQLASIDAQANQSALQQYWAAVEAEKQRQAQLSAQRAASSAQNGYYQYLMEAMKNQQQGSGLKNWDFGNGYSVQETPNGQAAYYHNGRAISAGDFLNSTDANWDKWNDIWNNGVSTQGVGSDTIAAFNRMYVNPYSQEYGYLF